MRIKKHKLITNAVATLLSFGLLIGFSAVTNSSPTARLVKSVGEETTLTIKGSATQVTTEFADGEALDEKIQGIDSNVTVIYYRTGTSTVYTPLNNASEQIRLYNSGGGIGQSIMVKTVPGYSIKDFTVNWTASNNGKCNYTSGTKNALDACSFIVQNIGNTSGTKNGQVRITSIVVTYFSY